MNYTYPLLFLFLASCSLTPEYQRPEVSTPPAWRMTEETTSALQEAEWWKQFASEELETLMQEALSHNYDIHASLARIEQARGARLIAGAPLVPAIDAGGSAERTRNSNSGMDNSARLGGSVAYELDLWGRNRAGLEAANADLAASEFDSNAVRLLVTAEVTTRYFEVLSLRERVRIARDNLANAQEVLEIAEARFREGAYSGLEVAQQRTAYAGAQAAAFSLERALDVAMHQLAVLVARPPQEISIAADGLQGIAIPIITPTQPASLLMRRPDIQRAEAALIAANADIGAARAAFLPQLDIGADATLIFNPSSSVLSLGAALVAPIFQGGRLEGALAISEARKMELAENYRRTILVSFQEVEDALAFIRAGELREAALRIAAEEARGAYTISRARYDAGAADFLTLLETQRSLLQAEDSYLQARLERLSASVQLFKALGGEWR